MTKKYFMRNTSPSAGCIGHSDALEECAYMASVNSTSPKKPLVNIQMTDLIVKLYSSVLFIIKLYIFNYSTWFCYDELLFAFGMHILS